MQSRLILFTLFALIVFLIHAPLLRLPFFWDEMGQFVPTSLDLFHTNSWVPHSAEPNVHPPAVMAYLAAFWSVTGFSVISTRAAMLLLASAGLLAAFLLAIEVAKGAPGMPAFSTAAMLCLSPLFVAQSMLAQLDMPAMVVTCVALLLFLRERIAWAAAACCLLVLVKETGIVLPAVLGGWLWYERRPRHAMYFLAPLIPLGFWLILLWRQTGNVFGNAEFANYNLLYSLNPVRLAMAFARRLYFLFVATGHWIGTGVLIYIWKKARLFEDRRWRVCAIFLAAHVTAVTVFGGAVLERYLLPALPLMYVAFAVAFAWCGPRLRIAGLAMLFAALILANFINPPYPFPLENNLAFVSFVSLHRRAAEFLEAKYPYAAIASSWPLSSALQRPEFGYVTRPLNVRESKTFETANLAALNGNVDALVLYPTVWDPWGLLRHRAWAAFLHRYYAYEPQVSPETAASLLGMRRVARWTQNGQWIEVLAR